MAPAPATWPGNKSKPRRVFSDTDEMKTSIDDFDNFTWGQIPLIEVRQ
jgi:hypothetical protein